MPGRSPTLAPCLSIIGIVISDAPAAPELDRLNKIYTEDGCGRDHKGKVYIFPCGCNHLCVHGFGGQESWKFIMRAVDPLCACIHDDDLIAWTQEGVVPAKCLLRML